MRKFLVSLVVFALFVAACGDGDDTGTTAAATGGDETTTAAPADSTAAETTAAPETTSPPETTATSGSGDGDATVADSPLLAALSQSAEQPTSGRMEGSMVMTDLEGMPAGSSFAIRFSSEFDAQGNSTMIMDMSDIADVAPEGEEVPPELAAMLGEMEIRTIGDTAYLRFGMLAMLGIETEWVSMEATDAGSTASNFGANPVDPTQFMSAFGSGVSDLEDLGQEQVRGVNTTHYRMIVDMEEMMAAADEEALAELEELGGGTLPIDETPVDFWIGDDGYIYRFAMEFDGTTMADSGFGTMAMNWEMFDYGADISIVAPPEDEVTDGSGLAGFVTP
jgi:hypothetical protein